MHSRPCYAALACLLLAGCGQEPARPSRTFIWDTQERPYEIIAVDVSDVPKIGDQTRVAQAIYPRPEEQADVEQALLEIYGEFVPDIQKTQPDAEYRRVVISIFDAAEDLRHDSRAWLCWLVVAPKPGEELPEDPSAFVQWQWRDPAERPTGQGRQIEWEYLAELAKINGSVPFPIGESELLGMYAAERRQYIEDRYAADVEDLKHDMAEAHDMSVEELQALLDRVMQWKYENEKLRLLDSDKKPASGDSPQTAAEPSDVQGEDDSS